MINARCGKRWPSSLAACSKFLNSVSEEFFRRSITGVYALAIVVLTTCCGNAGVETPYIVHSDRGGYLQDRLIEINNFKRKGTRVEIRGRLCYSTCTMLIGLSNVCVSPDTVFGFHGPSRSGRKLSKDDFDYFSEVMASHYPAPLRKWFMKTGRNRISGVHKVSGAKLIEMGVAACAAR